MAGAVHERDADLAAQFTGAGTAGVKGASGNIQSKTHRQENPFRSAAWRSCKSCSHKRRMAPAGAAAGGLGAASAEPSTSAGHRMMLNAAKSILQVATACKHG